MEGVKEFGGLAVLGASIKVEGVGGSKKKDQG